MKHLILILILTLLVPIGCGSSVKPIDLHDPNVPLDARRFVADAQDAVSIARARRDEAADRLAFAENWQDEVTTPELWPKGSDAILQKLKTFTQARVDMSELEFEQASAKLDLAEAKYDLSTAQTAMRNDLAVYDLEPLKARAESIRGEIETLSGKIEDQRLKLDKLTLDWWKSYSKFAGDKEVRAFYVSPQLFAELKARDADLKAKRAEKKKQDEKDAKDKDKKNADKDAKKDDTPAKKPSEEKITEDDAIDLDL